MIIDLILDRKDGDEYNTRQFYGDLFGYSRTFPTSTKPIMQAMDSGTETDVRRELCRYITDNGYRPAICEYINTQNWIEGSATT